jgi:hypothetical protein
MVAPSAVVTETVPEPSVRRLCLGKEVKIAAPQRDELLRWRRLPAHHYQAAGDVIDAVAVLVPGHDAISMLKQADVIGQPLQVPERRSRIPAASRSERVISLAEKMPGSRRI